MKLLPGHPLRTLAAGALAMLPLVATVLLVGWTWRFLADWVGPDSAFGQLLTRIGLGLAGTWITGYLAGVLAVAACVYLLGLLVEAGLERGLSRALDYLMGRIPIVRNVYDISSRLVQLFAKPEKDGLQSMSAVWLYFGGKPGAGNGVGDGACTHDGQRADAAEPAARTTVLLGLLSTPVPVLIGGQPFHAVLVPTAPVPIGGGLLYVPADWVEPADLGVEAVTSIYVSMGVTSAQYMKTAPRTATSAATPSAATPSAPAPHPPR
jgi:uncharacterized membrane protein